MQVIERQLPTRDELVGCAQRGFHYSTTISENVGGTGSEPERGVHFGILQP